MVFDFLIGMRTTGHAIPAKSNLKFNKVFFSTEIGRHIFRIVYEELVFEKLPFILLLGIDFLIELIKCSFI